MFRKLCIEVTECDDSLQGDLLRHWKLILNELGTLSNIKIDRCYFPMHATLGDLQLHGFSDTYIDAYTTVVCLGVTYSDNSVITKILASKT